MALSRKEKEQLVTVYKANLEGSKSIIALKQSNIPVNEINDVRSQLSEANGKMMVVKKRIFLNVMKEAGYEGCELPDLDGSVVVLYSYEDEFAPLKNVSSSKKVWKKAKVEFGFDYLGGWFEKVWKDSKYISEMADMPSKEELLGKLVYMINYPLQSFAMALDQIRQKKEAGSGESIVKEEPKKEEVKVEITEESKTEEVAKNETSEEIKSEGDSNE